MMCIIHNFTSSFTVTSRLNILYMYMYDHYDSMMYINSLADMALHACTQVRLTVSAVYNSLNVFLPNNDPNC